MIDFRYHIVSIISIFLALAIGIVLGAGPLQNQLGSTLSTQVRTLRTSKDNLTSQLQQTDQDLSNRDAWITAMTPEVVDGRLEGRTVTLLELPGSSGSIAKSVTSVLKTAGATVNGTVSVKTAWTDPAKKAARDTLATQLAAIGKGSSPAGATQDQELDTALARGLVTTDESATAKPDTGAQTVLAALQNGGLVDFSGKGPDPSTLVVVLAGAPTSGEALAQEQAEATAYATMARTLDTSSDGVVVVSDSDGAADGATLHAIRTDKQASAVVSTVDDADEPQGLVTTVLALRQQIDGSAGQYGSASGNKGPVPTPSGS